MLVPRGSWVVVLMQCVHCIPFTQQAETCMEFSKILWSCCFITNFAAIYNLNESFIDYMLHQLTVISAIHYSAIWFIMVGLYCKQVSMIQISFYHHYTVFKPDTLRGVDQNSSTSPFCEERAILRV